MEIYVHCDDGTDPDCWGTVPIELDFSGQCDVKYNWTIENFMKNRREIVESVIIIPVDIDEWIRQNKDKLSLFDIDSLQKEGFFEIGYSELDHKVCRACGSDQDYNEEGENISAL